MNGQKLPEGGILFDETDDDEDDAIASSPENEVASVGASIDWSAGWKNETG